MKRMRVDRLTTAVRTVKILAVNVHTLSLDNVLDMIRFFPCLEKLLVKVAVSSLTIPSVVQLSFRYTHCSKAVKVFMSFFSVMEFG